jgi:hypothetical protein
MDHELSLGERLALAVLMFFSAEPWSDERRREWRRLTGYSDATTKVLGDLARVVAAEEKAKRIG